MRIGKIPHILLIIIYLACTLLLLATMTEFGHEGAMHEERHPVARFSHQPETNQGMRLHRSVDGARVTDPAQENRNAFTGGPVAGLYPFEPGLCSMPAAQVNDQGERVQGTAHYHRGRILVRFSPEMSGRLGQGYQPGPYGRVGRMVSRGGFYEVFPEEGESVEELLERYRTQSPDIVQDVQFDYECQLIEDDSSMGAQTIEEDYEAVLSSDAKAELTNTELVQAIQDPNQRREILWYLNRIRVEDAWQETKGNQLVIIALLDSGIAYEDYPVPVHESSKVQSSQYIKAPSLEQTRFWTNLAELIDNNTDDDMNGYVDDEHGYDFVNRDAHPNDDNGHGTHLASILAANTGDPSTDTGIAQECTLMSLKVLDYKGIGYASSIAEAIYYAVDNGARVINLSLAWPPGINPGPVVQEAVAYAANAGVTLVGGSGNNAKDIICYPAAYEEVIAVGGTSYPDVRVFYSNYGEGLEIMSPGGLLTSDQNSDGYADGILQPTFSIRYRLDVVNGEQLSDTTSFTHKFMQGTSIATAEVSGIVGLMLSVNPNLDMKDIRIILRETARDLGDNGYDKEYGYGLIDASSAVLRAKADGVIDMDNDGYASWNFGGTDCNDNDPGIHPGAVDIPNDGIDHDCNGSDPIDADGDGYASIETGGTDCNDADPQVNLGAVDILNDGIDQDCNGFDFVDLDKDGSAALEAGGQDCNDLDPSINPGAMEMLNDGIDQDCDGADLVSSAPAAPDESCSREYYEGECHSCSEGDEVENECP